MRRLLKDSLVVFGIVWLVLAGLLTYWRNSSSPVSWIVYASLRDGNTEVSRILPDGSHNERLTNNTINGFFAGVSPDTNSILTLVWDGSAFNLYKMGIDGTNPQFLAIGWSPKWSPDGKWIAY